MQDNSEKTKKLPAARNADRVIKLRKEKVEVGINTIYRFHQELCSH
jgi:hypothetical protein